MKISKTLPAEVPPYPLGIISKKIIIHLELNFEIERVENEKKKNPLARCPRNIEIPVPVAEFLLLHYYRNHKKKAFRSVVQLDCMTKVSADFEPSGWAYMQFFKVTYEKKS